MAFMLAAILLFIIGLILVVVVSDYLSGRTELFTHRNIYLAGMVYFQLWNAIPVLFDPVAERYSLQDPIGAGRIYVSWAMISVVVFLLAYRRVSFVGTAVKRIRLPEALPSATTVWVIILFLIPLSAGMRFGVRVQYIGVLMSFTGLALTCAAAGLAAWQWGRNLFNPFVALMTLGTFLASAFISSIGEFSRRPLLSVVFAIGCGFYYGRLRHRRPAEVLPQVAVFGLAGILAVSLFSAGGRSLSGFAKALNPREAFESIEIVTETYSTARMAMWLVEANYLEGRGLEVPPLLTITYSFTLPIPRAIWADKPYTISTYLADWSDQRGVKRGRGGVTNPVGIVGNSAAEGGWWTVPIYAVFMAMLLRFFDIFTGRDPGHPIVAIGAATMLGQAFALPRGETAVMAFSYMWGQLTAFFLLYFIAWGVDRLLGRDERMGTHASVGAHAGGDGWDEEGTWDDDGRDGGNWCTDDPDGEGGEHAEGFWAEEHEHAHGGYGEDSAGS